jgi:uncharacterized protein (TIGR01319 family)
MNELGRQLKDSDRFVITDVGSTTTKAILFRRNRGDWGFHFEEAPTTVEKPYEDVTIGVHRAIEALERATGETLLREGRPAVPYLSTSSAGGGLAMIVTGLVLDMTAESADRVALGAGAIVLEVIAMNDHRTPYRKIEDLKRLRPDMVLLAGGFDAEAISGPVFLAELLLEADLHPKLNPQAKLPVIYSGNVNATDYVRREFSDRYLFQPAPNLRPAADREDPEPAREAIGRLFMDHVMSQAPGYEQLKEWVAAPILPTPVGFGKILALVSSELKTRVLAVDVGGATTDVFTASNGSVFRTVSANLGLSYSIMNVATLHGLAPVTGLLGQPMVEDDIWNRIGNKHIHPTMLAPTPEDMQIEWALATLAIREAVGTHFEVMKGGAPDLQHEDMSPDMLLKGPADLHLVTREALTMHDYGLIIGSGGILSHSPREAAAKMIVDALAPADDVELAVDSSFMFPHLGVLAEVNPELARELFFKLGIVRTGKAGAKHVFPAGYVPPTRVVELEPEPRIFRGELRLKRELAIPGTVSVGSGQNVTPDALVARSTRQFLRPFFLNGAQAIGVSLDEYPRYLLKQVGDEVREGEVVAKRERRLLTPKTYHSPVEGQVERILPDGTMVVREKPEHAREYTTVNVAHELGLDGDRIKPYLRVEVGQPLEKEQWIAAKLDANDFQVVKSPVRGKVNRIIMKYGMVVIEPLLEELEVRAWMPGVVAEVNERGCTVVNQGVRIDGVWGRGGEAYGPLRNVEGGARNVELRKGDVVVMDYADEVALQHLRTTGVAGLIAGGVNLHDVLDPNPPFTIVVLEGFGERKIAPEMRELLTGAQGRLALADGTTQMRVGVKRPMVILLA